MPELIVGKTAIPYVTRSSTVALRKRIIVTNNGVEVVHPSTASSAEVIDFVHRKRRWIYDKQQEIKERLASREESSFERLQSGAVIAYRGRNTRLKIIRTSCEELRIEYRNGIHVTAPRQLSSQQLEERLSVELNFWFRDRLKEDARKLADLYCTKLGLKPSRIAIVKSPSLWGSCTKKGVIKLNRELIVAPKSVLAYVVLHEACHLLHRSHSKQFWRLLASLMPDYAAKKKWLENINSEYVL